MIYKLSSSTNEIILNKLKNNSQPPWTDISNIMKSAQWSREHNYRQYNKHSLPHQLFHHNIAEMFVIKLGLTKKDGSQRQGKNINSKMKIQLHLS